MSNHRVNLFTDNAVPFGGMEPGDSLLLHWDELPQRAYNFQGVDINIDGPTTLWTLAPGTVSTLDLASLTAAGGTAGVTVTWRGGGEFGFSNFTVTPLTLALSIRVTDFDPGPFPSLPEPTAIALLSAALAGFVLTRLRK